MRRIRGLLVLAGCEQGADTDAQTDRTVEPFAGAPLAPLSDGDCPSMGKGGTKTFSSGGVEREIELIRPDEVTPGMPALVAWHGLGDSAGSMASWMQLQQFADDRGVIVVVPDSLDRSGNTWDFVRGGGLDLVLYDDLRTCLSDRLEVDLARFATTGFSFGGLWATFLTLNRADTLATSLIMSGGTSPFLLPYKTPATQLPALVMWGGPGDTFGEGITQVRFEETSLDLSNRLRDDGHLVAQCDHGLGHTVPDEIHDILGDWLDAHVYGEPSGLAGGLGSMPSWCTLP